MNWKLGVALLFAAALLPLAAGWYTCGFRGCPDPKALLALEPGEAPEVLDRYGESFARRQVGSAFKPFVYGAAVAGGIAPSHPLEDAPVSLEVPGAPIYEPTNFDNEFHGTMTARQALAAGKTAPQESADAWFVGYTPERP